VTVAGLPWFTSRPSGEREARRTAAMHRRVDRYPWNAAAYAGVYLAGFTLLARSSPAFAVMWASALFGLGLWTWRPGGRMRQVLAARYLGFTASAEPPRPRTRAERRFLVVLVAWCVMTLTMFGFLAVEYAGLETACPTRGGFDYAAARWQWLPPGPRCATFESLVGTTPPSTPAPWRDVLLVAPIIGVAVVVLTGKRAARDRVRELGPRRMVTNPDRVIAFFDERRRASPTVDFGFPWLDGPHHAWRVTWLMDTGELVGFRCTFPAAPASSHSRSGPIGRMAVETIAVLLVARDEARVRTVLDGYEHHVGAPDGWEWLRARVLGAVAH
jgi:hypothetical protein